MLYTCKNLGIKDATIEQELVFRDRDNCCTAGFGCAGRSRLAVFGNVPNPGVALSNCGKCSESLTGSSRGNSSEDAFLRTTGGLANGLARWLELGGSQPDDLLEYAGRSNAKPVGRHG